MKDKLNIKEAFDRYSFLLDEQRRAALRQAQSDHFWLECAHREMNERTKSDDWDYRKTLSVSKYAADLSAQLAVLAALNTTMRNLRALAETSGITLDWGGRDYGDLVFTPRKEE